MLNQRQIDALLLQLKGRVIPTQTVDTKCIGIFRLYLQ